jgi:Leucine Rich Repeat (LRR) protein
VSDKPKRRWYQFSLLTLLVVLTLLCVGPGGFVAYEQRKARQQQAAVEAIEKLGGSVEYDEEVPARSAMVRQILGDESFGNVDVVSLCDTQANDATLVHVAGLKSLKHLSLSDTQVTDAGLVYLAGLNGLTSLTLDNTQVTDAGLVHLAGLTKLEILLLPNTQVTDAGVAKLQKALPNCRIIR